MQVVDDALLLREDIDISWLFVGKVNLEEDATLQKISRICKDNLIELYDYQLQGVMVKLGKAKDPKLITVDVTKTCDQVQAQPIEVIPNDGEHIMWDIDVSTTIPIIENITNLGMIPYQSKSVIFGLY